MKKLYSFFDKWEEIVDKKDVCQWQIDFIQESSLEFYDHIEKGYSEHYMKDDFAFSMVYKFNQVFKVFDKQLPEYKFMEDCKKDLENIRKTK